jgi:uracil-DNA glycosylase
MPKIYNKSYEIHWASYVPEWAVYCGRGSPWGNPFVMKNESERDYVCDRFEKEILPTLDVLPLRGKDLVCYCAPKRCHCDSILKRANSYWAGLPFWQDSPYEEILKKVYDGSGTTFPPRELLFNAFSTQLPSVRVCILGQDPYPTPGHANGLAFSVNKDVYPLPLSLQNIFKELHDDLNCPFPDNGDLMPWAKQGVLLLNTSLTVNGKPGSHAGIWHDLIVQVVKQLAEFNVIFVLWGKHAQKYLPYITNKDRVIMSSHPSPLSADRGFFGSKPFSRVNAMLGDYPIRWCI